MSEQIYISLGYNCDPRIYLKNTLNITMANGYNTCPFDLCITRFESLYNCIETDFKYFFDDLKLIPGQNADGDRSSCGPGGMNITNYYNIIFNHEGSTHSHLFKDGKYEDLFYIKNDFEEFKKRYTVRIENFKNYLQNFNKIIFLLKKCPDDDSYNFSKISSLLVEKYREKDVIVLEI